MTTLDEMVQNLQEVTIDNPEDAVALCHLAAKKINQLREELHSAIGEWGAAPSINSIMKKTKRRRKK